ncbi:hypothetical protein DFQ30_002676 [Apophysomyces sp. BC1015]|nr:hypothetical protein DFQ30_002676 [Apophysomyces sp. BC1015]
MPIDPQWVIILVFAFLFGGILFGFACVHGYYILINRTTIEQLSTRAQEIRIDFDESGSNFEVVMVHQKERMFDVGKVSNWRIVMGSMPWEWFVPFSRGVGDGYVFPYNDQVYEKIVAQARRQREARLVTTGKPGDVARQ